MRIEREPDGFLRYTIDHSAVELACVTVRDLQSAYSLLGLSPLHLNVPRCFHFENDDGTTTQLALLDRDACSWAAALDERYGLRSTYTVAILCRLLALMDLLKTARWASDLVDRQRGSLKIARSLFAVAASIPLSASASFDVAAFKRKIAMPCSSNV